MAIGIILAVKTIGLQWAKLQWFIAALGVGLRLGLQEIVANFICGMIVLFERPFRVGDTVTVGETSGTVARTVKNRYTIGGDINKEIRLIAELIGRTMPVASNGNIGA